MLKKIKVKNFKAFKEETELELNGLTILSGVNSSGKSSIYQSLLISLQSFDSKVIIDDSYIQGLEIIDGYLEFGSCEEILNDITNKEVSFSYEWKDGTRINSVFELKDIKGKNKFLLKSSEYEDSDKDMFYKVLRCENGTWEIEAHNLLSFSMNSLRSDLEEVIGISKKIKRSYLKTSVKFTNVKTISFENHLLNKFSIETKDVVNCLANEARIKFNEDKQRKFKVKYRKKLEELGLKEDEINENEIVLENNIIYKKKYALTPREYHYVPPFRGIPRRVYFGNHLYKNYQEVVDDIIEYDYNFEKNQVIKGSVKEALDYWLVEKLNLVDDIEIIEKTDISSQEVFIKIGNKSLPITNVGYGISQIVPIIYNILTKKYSCVLLDEPEIHLHPKVQSDLAEFFYKITKLNRTVLIETHSEYLIEKLIYFKLKYMEDKINLVWVEREKNESKLKNIEYDKFGFILNHPNGFLSERNKIMEDLANLRMEMLENE